MTHLALPPGAKPFDIDRLPSTTAWPERLLGLVPWSRKPRTKEELLREYDREKYRAVLEWVERTPQAERTVEAAQAQVESSWGGKPRVISVADRLYEIDHDSFLAYRARIFEELFMPIASDGADAIIELGCGFGYQLSLVRRLSSVNLAGGELSPNAVAVARAVFRPEDRIEVVPFDFEDPPSYDRVLDASRGKSVTIFTSHALSNLPSARAFLDNARRHASRIRKLLHFEPLVGQFSAPTMLDHLRRAYARANHYNTDLLELLESAPDVVIEKREKDVLGENPLTPLNFLVWRFR